MLPPCQAKLRYTLSLGLSPLRLMGCETNESMAPNALVVMPL